MNFKLMAITILVLISMLIFGSCKGTVDTPKGENNYIELPHYENALKNYDLNKVAAILLFSPDYEYGDSLIEHSQITAYKDDSVSSVDDYSSVINIITIYGDTATGILKDSKYDEDLGIHQGFEQGKIIFDDGSFLDITVFQRGQWFDINGIEGHYRVDSDYTFDHTDLSTEFESGFDKTQLTACNKLILPTKSVDGFVFSFEDTVSLLIPYNEEKGMITSQDLFDVVKFLYDGETDLLGYKIDADGSLTLLYESDLGFNDGILIKWSATLNTITELIYLRL